MVNLNPELSWANNSASSYFLEVATDNAFNSVVYSATVASASHQITAIELSANTTYYWRVSGSNICGTGAQSAVSSFTTWQNGLACGGGENFSNGIPANWTVINNGTAPGWVSNANGDCGSTALPNGNFAGLGRSACADSRGLDPVDAYICSPPIPMANVQTMAASFLVNYQIFNFTEVDDLFDFVVTTDPQNGPYTSVFSVTADYPSGATAVPNSGNSENHALTPFVAGTDMYLCFHYTASNEWYAHIDDVSLSCTCTPPDAPANVSTTLNGGNIDISWTASNSAAVYEVWWGLDSPYFSSGNDCAAASNCEIASANNAHSVVVNSGASQSFVVKASNSCGEASGDAATQRVGGFSFTIEPGS